MYICRPPAMLDCVLLKSLIMYLLCTITVSQGCEDVHDRLCTTSNTTLNWVVARETCTSLGGTLAKLTPDKTDGLKGTAVWVGGRTSRTWTADNSPFYFGQWTGCVNNSVEVEFREYITLNDCLESCRLFQYAILNSVHCGCTNIVGNNTEKDLEAGCEDPQGWQSGPGNRTHQFFMRSKSMAEVRNVSEILTVFDNFTVEFRESNESLLALCQSTNNISGIQSIPYGNTGTFLWTSNTSVPYQDAESDCNKSGGTLAKMGWESDSLNRRLVEVFNNSQMWIGVSPINWRFLDGTKVSSVWSDFTPTLNDGCLLWNQSRLVTTTCFQNVTKLPGLCEFLPETSTADVTKTNQPRTPANESSIDYSGVYIAIGVTAGTLLVLGIVLLVICRIRRPCRAGKSSSLQYQTESTSDTYSGVSPYQTSDTVAGLEKEEEQVVMQTTNVNLRESFSNLYSAVNKTPSNATAIHTNTKSVDIEKSSSDDTVPQSGALTAEYDHLNVTSVTRTRDVDTSSTYNHVTNEVGE